MDHRNNPDPSSAAPRDAAPSAGDELLTIAEVADLVRAPVATLRYWRHLGTGPRSFRVGRGVRYWHHDVTDWLHQQSNNPQPSR